MCLGFILNVQLCSLKISKYIEYEVWLISRFVDFLCFALNLDSCNYTCLHFVMQKMNFIF
jgi:hypothetical protein